MRRHIKRSPDAAADTVSDRIPEWRLQAEAAAELDALASAHGFEWAASLEGVIGNLNPYQARLAKATGVKRGEPDIRLYLPGARLVKIEMKGDGGSLTKEQRERFPRLQALGFVVHVVKVKTPEEARAAVRAIVLAELGLG